MMNNLEISTDPSLLSVDLPSSLNTSPSVSTFLPEEDASTCPLLPATPSPPPMACIHPLSANNGDEKLMANDAATECDDSSSSNSGIGINLPIGSHHYHHLEKKCDIVTDKNVSNMQFLNIQMTKDTPGFVSWNWPVIRRCTFVLFLSLIVGMTAMVITMIATLPKTCNPRSAWYRGVVFYEIFPASFQDSNGDGIGDINGVASKIDYLEDLGIGAIRLNSIFPAKHYPENFRNMSSLSDIDQTLGTKKDLSTLIGMLHKRNMSLVLDIPLNPLYTNLDIVESGLSGHRNLPDEKSEAIVRLAREAVENRVSIKNILKEWLSLGVDGFYMKDLEHFTDDPYVIDNIKQWKYIIGDEKVLIVSKLFIQSLNSTNRQVVMEYVDLIDVYINARNGTQQIANTIEEAMNITDSQPPNDGPWIHWTLGGVNEKRISNPQYRDITLAATLMQLMLPGTPSIFYGDEVALQTAYDPNNEYEDAKALHHLTSMKWSDGNKFTSSDSLAWIPSASVMSEHYKIVKAMVALRSLSPSIYQNCINRNGLAQRNSVIRTSEDDLIIIQRWYPRRNTFVGITNLGMKNLTMDLSALFFSGQQMLDEDDPKRIYFSDFNVTPYTTAVVKLYK